MTIMSEADSPPSNNPLEPKEQGPSSHRGLSVMLSVVMTTGAVSQSTQTPAKPSQANADADDCRHTHTLMNMYLYTHHTR
jgi:hypothetical protein